jgi:xylulose-5-phosphate/fructose-6-phosphate phosphoketolase
LNSDLCVEDLKSDSGFKIGKNPIVNALWACFDIISVESKSKFIFVNGSNNYLPSLLSNLFIEGSLQEMYPQFKTFQKQIADKEVIYKSFFSSFGASKGFGFLPTLKMPSCIYEAEEYGTSVPVSIGASLFSQLEVIVNLIDKNEVREVNFFESLRILKEQTRKSTHNFLPILALDSKDAENADIESYLKGLGFELIDVEANDLFEPLFDGICSALNSIGKKRFPIIIIKTPAWWPHNLFTEDFDPWGNQKHLIDFEDYLKNIRIDELVDKNYEIAKHIYEYIPSFEYKMGLNRVSNSVEIEELTLPEISELSKLASDSTIKTLGLYVNEIFNLNQNRSRFRVLHSYNEQKFKKLEILDSDNIEREELIASKSATTLFGLQQGLCLTGKNSLFILNELFAQSITSKIDQYCKFVSDIGSAKWRKPIPSLNIVLIYNCSSQIHDKNSGFISSLLNNYSNILDIYVPCDSNTLLVTLDEMFKSRNRVNVTLVSDCLAQSTNILNLEKAKQQLAEDIMVWEDFSQDNPDVVLVGAGDYAMAEILKTQKLLKDVAPEIRTRVVYIAQLSCFGIGDNSFRSRINGLRFDEIFTTNRPIILNYNGYAEDIKSLIFNHHASSRFSIHGYLEKGSSLDHEQRLYLNQQDASCLALEALEFASIYNQSVEKNLQKYKQRILSYTI